MKTIQFPFIIRLVLSCTLLTALHAEGAAPAFISPNSVEGTMIENELPDTSFFRLESVDNFFISYNEWKASINKEHNFHFGGDYQTLYQNANPSLTDKEAFSGVFRIYGTYKAYNADSANSGSLIFKVENRHTLGSHLDAQNYGFSAGYYGITGTLFGEYTQSSGWGVTNLFWKQYLNDGKISIAAGILDPTDYLGVYGLMNPMTAFSNLAFSSDQTMFLPNQGLGIAAASMLNDNFYMIANLSDANADAQEAGFDTFFEDNKYFTSVEIGWTTVQARIYFDNIHVTLWHVDEHSKFNASPEGWGANFSAAWFAEDTWMPFLRAGFSEDGAALMQKNVSAGVGYYVNQTRDLFGFGLNWADPSDDSLRDQTTAEMFYRLQLAQSIAITPSIQYFKDPALYPTESSMWLFGVRARFTF